MEMQMQDIIYEDIKGLKNISARAVMTKGRSGEFHVKSLTGYACDDLVQLLRGIIDNADIGVIGLDYDAYIKSESVLTTDNMELLLAQADKTIGEIQNV